MDTNEITPAVGQIWADNDYRVRMVHGCDRLVRINEIDGDKAICEAWYDRVGETSRTVRIKLARFRPTSTGYRYLRAGDE